MNLLSRSSRPRRLGEWTSGKAVTFIVTLAVTRSVTLAARKAGMSRKSAYALKARDSTFAAAWSAAIAAAWPGRREGDKAYEVDRDRIRRRKSNIGRGRALRLAPDLERDLFFAELLATRAVAPKPRLP